MEPNFKIIQCNRVNVPPVILHDKLRKHSVDILGKFFLGIFLLFLIKEALPEIISVFVPTTMADVIAHYNPSVDMSIIERMPSIPVCVYIYALMFNGMFNLGESLFCLTVIRNKKVEIHALWEGISYYFKTLLLFIVQTVIISFWSFFFLIPGIIAAINFSQSFLILADNPEKNLFECLIESKLRMRGNRKMFITYLVSFLPYILLGAIIPIAAGLLLNIDNNTMMGHFITVGLNAPLYLAIGYWNLGKTLFYELLITGGFEKFKYKAQDVFRQPQVNNGEM